MSSKKNIIIATQNQKYNTVNIRQYNSGSHTIAGTVAILGSAYNTLLIEEIPTNIKNEYIILCHLVFI